jgi:alkanesulfonate monooxygenase SsuD/methylene tetrahydromethanopterin reductase-like flavin-dependent oxidoreductase (luciferase family)
LLWSPQEKFNVQRMLAASACGSPPSVQQQLASIVEQTAADELIVAGAVHDHAARLRSYELLASAVATSSLPTSTAGSS